MRSLNKIFLIGKLDKEPEIRQTKDGLAVANLVVVTKETFQGKDGNERTYSEWHKVVAFGKLAEICGEYLNKDKNLYIEGRIQTRSWTDKEGKKRYFTEIIANNIIILDSEQNKDNFDNFQVMQPKDKESISDEDDEDFDLF